MKTFYEKTSTYYNGVKYDGTVSSMVEINEATGLGLVVAEGLVKFTGRALNVGDWVVSYADVEDDKVEWFILSAEAVANMKMTRNAKAKEDD